MTFTIDPNSNEAIEFSTTYNYGQWVELLLPIDTDAGTMNILIAQNASVNSRKVSNLVGSINFYPTSKADGAPALYYVDDIVVSSYEEMPVCDIAAVAQLSIDMEFEAEPSCKTCCV